MHLPDELTTAILTTFSGRPVGDIPWNTGERIAGVVIDAIPGHAVRSAPARISKFVGICGRRHIEGVKYILLDISRKVLPCGCGRKLGQYSVHIIVVLPNVAELCRLSVILHLIDLKNGLVSVCNLVHL